MKTRPAYLKILTLVIGVSVIAIVVVVLDLNAPHAMANEPASLDQILEPIRSGNHLPALAAAVVCEGKTIACGAVGFRKAGSPERVTLNDTWHIGSCTKSMTAALAGMMVDEGQWRWDMSVSELFPDIANKIQPGWRKATLEQFLTHFSGAGNDDSFDPGLLARSTRSPLEQRAQFINEFLIQHGPTTVPGTAWKYDNANYAVVGHALELKLKRPWETLIRERLFTPLTMNSAGFGPPASPNAIDQPYGHVLDEEGNLKPIPPDLVGESRWVSAWGLQIRADNPAALAPAGTVHCNIGDLAKYAAWQLCGARGKNALLKPATFKKLHTRFKKDCTYACGWEVDHRDWAGGDALFHGGSNGTFMTVIWLAPKKDFAVVVCANLGGADCQAVVDKTVGVLIQKYLVER